MNPKITKLPNEIIVYIMKYMTDVELLLMYEKSAPVRNALLHKWTIPMNRVIDYPSILYNTSLPMKHFIITVPMHDLVRFIINNSDSELSIIIKCNCVPPNINVPKSFTIKHIDYKAPNCSFHEHPPLKDYKCVSYPSEINMSNVHVHDDHVCINTDYIHGENPGLYISHITKPLVIDKSIAASCSIIEIDECENVTIDIPVSKIVIDDSKNITVRAKNDNVRIINSSNIKIMNCNELDIIDVTNLHGGDIRKCKIDISKNIHLIDINECKITGSENIKINTIKKCNVDDVEKLSVNAIFEKCKLVEVTGHIQRIYDTANIIKCDMSKLVMPFDNILHLKLNRITNMNALHHATKLIMVSVHAYKGFFNINNCPNLVDVGLYKNPATFTIKKCAKLISITASNIKGRLTLSGLPKLTHVKTGTQTIVSYGCCNIQEIHIMQKGVIHSKYNLDAKIHKIDE